MLKTVLKIALGDLLLAAAAAAFLLPNGLMATGSTGLALILARLCPLDVPAAVALINAAAFLLGLLLLGRRFAMTTLLSTVLYPISLDIVQHFLTRPLVEDMLTACIGAALLSGLGVGLVIGSGASTGGMDIPAILFSRWTGVPVATCLCAMDMLILLGQAVSSAPDRIVYGMLTALMIGVVVDKVIVIGAGQAQVLIVSPRYREIGACIRNEVDRGMTFVEICTGYEGRRQQAVLSVVTHRELPRLREKALSIDPEAFVIITDVKTVHGRGSTMAR